MSSDETKEPEVSTDETTSPDGETPAPAKKPRGNTAKKDAIVLKALERDMKAVKLRVSGKTYEFIAQLLGYGHRGNAVRAIQRRLKKMRAECASDVAELRFLECRRLDVALAAIMRKVRHGDLQAIDRLLRIQERRAAYEGLDQPKGLKVELAREIESYLDQLRDELDEDVYERVLAIFAGERVAPPPPHEEGGETGEDGGGEGEGSSEPPPAPSGV